jgi:hypothetical protein
MSRTAIVSKLKEIGFTYISQIFSHKVTQRDTKRGKIGN